MSGLFVFHGGDGKVGVSMIAQSVAEIIARGKPELNILLVNLQGKYGSSYIEEIRESVESLRHYLENRLLDKQSLLENCRYRGNLSVIGGVSTIGEERYYHPEMSSYLLSELKGDFDLILADSGSDVDNGLALGTLTAADEIYMVMTQQESVLRRIEKLRPLYQRLGLSFSTWICNRFEEGDPYSKNYLCKRLALEACQLITVTETGEGRRAEAEEKSLLTYRNRIYDSDISKAADHILIKSGYSPLEKQRKRKWKNLI